MKNISTFEEFVHEGEKPIFKDHEEYVRPDHVIITLNNDQKIRIGKKHIKGGKRVYQMVLHALDNQDDPKMVKFLNNFIEAAVAELKKR